MKKLLMILSLVLCVNLCVAQHKPTIKVSYKYTHPVQTMRSAVPDVTNEYVLLSDGTNSKFYSPRTEFIDSIESTPEGFENFNTFKRECWQSGNQKDIPKVDGSFYIIKERKDKKIHTYDIASATRFHFVEPITEINWEITDSIKNIVGYDCQLAVGYFHGRKWLSWFTTDIPIQDGPWKLGGLPGLILAAECEGGLYAFEADGIQETYKHMMDVYGKEKWEAIDRKDFWNLRRECLANPRRNVNSQGGTVLVFKNVEYTDHFPAEIVDYIETDYR